MKGILRWWAVLDETNTVNHFGVRTLPRNYNTCTLSVIESFILGATHV